MAAAVLAPPAPLHPPSGALYDSDDLLALRVLDEAGLVPHGEDYTDDLEDLVSPALVWQTADISFLRPLFGRQARIRFDRRERSPSQYGQDAANFFRFYSP
ncbi:hypothetical protein JCM10295v2_006659 [Rhodotorula toruloides]